eukprot:COSAG01_NODE_23366_length_818_cov_0.812239_1_plen_119_part_00
MHAEVDRASATAVHHHHPRETAALMERMDIQQQLKRKRDDYQPSDCHQDILKPGSRPRSFVSFGGTFVVNYARQEQSTAATGYGFPPGDSVYCTRDPEAAKRLKAQCLSQFSWWPKAE